MMAKDTLDDLREVVQSLTDEIRVLSMAVDDLHGDLQWSNRNLPLGSDGHEQLWRPLPVHVTSLPLDPAARDWKINAVDQAAVQRLRPEAVAQGRSANQQQLF